MKIQYLFFLISFYIENNFWTGRRESIFGKICWTPAEPEVVSAFKVFFPWLEMIKFLFLHKKQGRGLKTGAPAMHSQMKYT